MEIAVYAYDRYEYPTSVEEFYRAKDGRATKEMVDRGLVAFMNCGYFDETEWLESIGHSLLHPMEDAAEVIRRAHKEEDTFIATEMLQNGDPSTYFSLIEPADKEWLMRLAEKQKDV